MIVTITHWLVFANVMFSLGIYGLLTRRSAVGILISIEFMLNAAAVNFVAINKTYFSVAVDGQIMALFIVALAAAEILVALAILVMIFRSEQNVDITHLSTLKN